MKILTFSNYKGGSFNSAELLGYVQQTQILVTGQFTDCKTTEFLFSLDNRLSDTAFLSGLIANTATQFGTYAGYYALATFITDSTVKAIFTKLKNSSSLNMVVAQTYAFYLAFNANPSTVNFSAIGTILTQFMLSFVNFKTPNVNTARKTS